MAGSPPPEVPITAELVEELIRRQMPEFSGERVTLLASGWDNSLFRLGEALTVRLPRRHAAVAAVEHEHRWLPILAPRLPIPVPVPIRRGVADQTFPWTWTVAPWIEGTTALRCPLEPAAAASAAASLGDFLAALHRPAPSDAPTNPWRGIPLDARAPITLGHLSEAADLLTPPSSPEAILAVWNEAAATPPWSEPAVWLHGDLHLHPDNIIVEASRVAGVIDFGDLCAGDPAGDLALGWMLFEAGDRRDFEQRAIAAAPAHTHEATLVRARGWAVAIGLALLAHSDDRPDYRHLALRTLDRLVATARA